MEDSCRSNRFYELGPQDFNFRKIGEYQRTDFYEYHLKSLQISLHQIHNLLQKELSENSLFRNAWEKAETLYMGKRAAYPKKIKSSSPKEYYKAVICFTLPKIYEDFTRQSILLADKEINWEKFTYQSLLYLLFQAELRMSIPQEDLVISDRSFLKTYRCLGPHISVSNLKIRDLVTFSHITPTTRDLNMALTDLNMTGGTLVEIQKLRWSCKEIEFLSFVPQEEEVLIWPWIKFYVTEIIQLKPDLTKLVIVPTSEGLEQDENANLNVI